MRRMAQHGGTHGADRRPWVILSLREAQALRVAALEWLVVSGQQASDDLQRALVQVDQQQRWIAGETDNDAPSVTHAVVREAAENHPGPGESESG